MACGPPIMPVSGFLARPRTRVNFHADSHPALISCHEVFTEVLYEYAEAPASR